MTHHVKQSSFAGVWQCYSYVRHTHTHTQKHTKSIFFPPSSSTFPKFSLAASSTAAHIISREWHAAPKNTQRFSTVSRSSCQATFLCKEPIHPTNLLQTFFFSYTLQGQICNVKLCGPMSTYCTCIIPCVNQTGQDLTCSFLKASAWSVVCLRHMATRYQLQKSYKNWFWTELRCVTKASHG